VYTPYVLRGVLRFFNKTFLTYKKKKKNCRFFSFLIALF